MRRLRKHVGIDDKTFYWARYTWATMADKIGIPEKEISKGLGHKDNTIAGKHYIAYDWTKVDRANRQVIDYVLAEAKKPPPSRVRAVIGQQICDN